MSDRKVFINAIGCAVPTNDVHRQFVDWAESQLEDRRERLLFRRMADRSGIDHRWSVLPPAPGGGSPTFYEGSMPSTARRMATYAEAAPQLALQAIEQLRRAAPLEGITHLVVASCTGFVAPGIDQLIVEELGLGDVERTLIGFMGCYAAVIAVRTARHIVRSEPGARVLVVTVELSSLHLQEERRIEPLLAMLQFGDGSAAALVTAEPPGFAIGRNFSLCLPRSADLIRWTIGDSGFSMHLSGEVPSRIGAGLQEDVVRRRIYQDRDPGEVDCWAVHAGGRSILDAVERGLELVPELLAESRDVLARYGNMSSSTLLFVLSQLLGEMDARRGIAVAFGPGLATEGFHFERA